MKIKNTIFLFCFLLLLNGTVVIAQEASPKMPAAVIVLCDVSNSITLPPKGFTSRINEMKTMCKQLLRHYPHDSKISFYLISSNAVFVPFVEFNASIVKQRSSYKVREELNQKEIDIDSKIDQAVKTAEKQSCILTSVENALDIFAAESNQSNIGLKNELIIFSDLLEQCRNTSIGKIWMNDKEGPLLTKEELTRLNTYKHKNTWKNLQVHIRVINTSAMMYPAKKNNIQSAWSIIFSRMGFAQQQIPFLAYQNFEPNPSYIKKYELRNAKF